PPGIAAGANSPLVGSHIMNIHEATTRYESWLGARTTLLPEDLDRKHTEMHKDAYSFLRATFYRWVQTWPEVCPGLQETPRVLAVGDLHVENFGTWRDREGRLVWGVNDFDEAHWMSYTNDLVRLATSALLAISAGALQATEEEACEAIRKGYARALESGGE